MAHFQFENLLFCSKLKEVIKNDNRKEYLNLTYKCWVWDESLVAVSAEGVQKKNKLILKWWSHHRALQPLKSRMLGFVFQSHLHYQKARSLSEKWFWIKSNWSSWFLVNDFKRTLDLSRSSEVQSWIWFKWVTESASTKLWITEYN